MKPTIFDLMVEIQRRTKIDEKHLQKAQESKIDIDNYEFLMILGYWLSGFYDERPDYCVNELIQLLEK